MFPRTGNLPGWRGGGERRAAGAAGAPLRPGGPQCPEGGAEPGPPRRTAAGPGLRRAPQTPIFSSRDTVPCNRTALGPLRSIRDTLLCPYVEKNAEAKRY